MYNLLMFEVYGGSRETRTHLSVSATPYQGKVRVSMCFEFVFMFNNVIRIIKIRHIFSHPHGGFCGRDS